MPRKLGIAYFFLGALACFLGPALARAQRSDLWPRPRSVVTQKIDETKRVTLPGNTRPEASLANDRGAVAESFPVEHMQLQLKRSPEQEHVLQQFIDEQQTPGSPNFHRWITAQEFGERFGLAKEDLDAITIWLKSHSFKINVVYANGMLIDFSGTAGQVREAFQTEIHHLEVKGERHIANIGDPRIPAALAPAVSGIVSLHDFRPRAMYKMHQPRAQYTFPDSLGGNSFGVVPADLATIYNLNPLQCRLLRAGPDDCGHRRHGCLQHRGLEYLSLDARPFRVFLGLLHDGAPRAFNRAQQLLPSRSHRTQ
jgi:hypothetical protein